MNRRVFIITIIIISVVVGTLSACSAQKIPKETNELKKEKIVVDGLPEEGVMFVGTQEQVGKTKNDMKELIDPAYDNAILAREYYDKKDYVKAEQECLKALQLGKQGVVKASAHRTLSYIYEATERYDLAIKEIDWLLNNVNEYAKAELLQKRQKFQEMLTKNAPKE